MIDWLTAVLLGLVQGATEYLPVSSSGHLVLARHLLGLRQPVLLFDVVLHLATLLVVVWYYRHDVVSILRQGAAGLAARLGGEPWSSVQARLPHARLAWLIVVGTAPTAAIGVTFHRQFERLFGSLGVVGSMLWITGLVLVLTRRAPMEGRRVTEMRLSDALLIGLVQGLAITPGISRSGATIAAALGLGIERETAARYSFLLSAPSIVGALLMEANGTGAVVGPGAIALGFAAALVSGYLCLALLVRLLKRGQLAWFAPWCLAAGVAAFALAKGL